MHHGNCLPLKEAFHGLLRETTLPSDHCGARRKDVCALRYSDPSLELLAASPGPSCRCSRAFPSIAIGEKNTLQSVLQGVQLHRPSLQRHLLQQVRKTPVAWRLSACSLHLCCKTSYRREARQSLLCSPPPSKQRGKCLSREVRIRLLFLAKYAKKHACIFKCMNAIFGMQLHFEVWGFQLLSVAFPV